MLPSIFTRGLSSATAAAKGPLPIIICGKKPQVNAAVTTALQPDYTVAHFIQSPAAGVRDLPTFLRRNPDTAEEGATPVAVIVGGGYTDDDMKLMQEACVDRPSVVWLKIRPMEMSGPLPPFAEYGAQVGRTAKGVLNELRSRGQLGKGQTCYL